MFLNLFLLQHPLWSSLSSPAPPTIGEHLVTYKDKVKISAVHLDYLLVYSSKQLCNVYRISTHIGKNTLSKRIHFTFDRLICHLFQHPLKLISAPQVKKHWLSIRNVIPTSKLRETQLFLGFVSAMNRAHRPKP